jgi:hypothetical protein
MQDRDDPRTTDGAATSDQQRRLRRDGHAGPPWKIIVCCATIVFDDRIEPVSTKVSCDHLCRVLLHDG